MRKLRLWMTMIVGIVVLAACAAESKDLDTKSLSAAEAETLRLLSVYFLKRDDRKSAIEALRVIDDRSDEDEAMLSKLLKEERAQEQRRRFSVDGAHLNSDAL